MNENPFRAWLGGDIIVDYLNGIASPDPTNGRFSAADHFQTEQMLMNTSVMTRFYRSAVLLSVFAFAAIFASGVAGEDSTSLAQQLIREREHDRDNQSRSESAGAMGHSNGLRDYDARANPHARFL